MSQHFDTKFLIVILCVYIANGTFLPYPGNSKFSKDTPPAFVCVDSRGTVVNPDGNYQNPADCTGYIACAGGTPVTRSCGAVPSLFYVPFGDFCGYAVNNKQCPNYWAQGAQNEMGANGCPTSSRWSGSAPMLVPTKDKADKCTTYLICKTTPVLASCPTGYFFSIQSFSCLNNYWKNNENCNE